MERKPLSQCVITSTSFLARFESGCWLRFSKVFWHGLMIIFATFEGRFSVKNASLTLRSPMPVIKCDKRVEKSENKLHVFIFG